MLLSDDLFVDFDGTIGISDPVVLNVEVAHFPSFGGLGMDLLLDFITIQERSDSDLIKARHIAFLLNTLCIDVFYVRTGVQETRFNGM